ncbi:MAG: Cytochrome c oxidase subunit 3 [Pseudomonadota bacterium]|jgi:nitric oxide reductase NorE protein
MNTTRASGADRRRLPGGVDIWVFVLGDMLIFSAYFAAYLFADRMRQPALFVASQQQLSQNLGFCNTLILLTSSLFVALGVHAAGRGDTRIASRFIELGGACGVTFLFVKSYEWYAKLTSGLTISSNAFFMHYYVMTGVHVVHILIGLTFLVVLWRELRFFARAPDGALRHAATPRQTLIEAGGIYWHMVDFLWFLIFALLYLMR